MCYIINTSNFKGTIKMITEAQLAKITYLVHETMTKILGSKYNGDLIVQVKTDMKKVAGRACLYTKLVQINEQLFLKNEEAFYTRTIPHECAHHIVHILYPDAKQYHGPEFRYIMKLLGVDGSTYHDYDVAPALTGVHFRYSCSCEGRVLNLTKLIHKKICQGQKRHCNKCKQSISFIG